MQIGFVTKEQFEGNSWLKMTIRAPFCRAQDFKISKNETAKGNEPDYYIYALINGKNEKFRHPRVGALWLKESQSGEKYMSGKIESPMFAAGEINIALVKAKPLFDAEAVTWIYDALWSPPDYKKKQEEKQQEAVSAAVVDDEEIPF